MLDQIILGLLFATSAPCEVEDGSELLYRTQQTTQYSCNWIGSDPDYGNGVGLSYVVLYATDNNGDGYLTYKYSDGHEEL